MPAIGLFHTRLNVRTGLLGAPVLTLDLLVNTVQKKITGVASIFAATYPPLNFHADVWGDYSDLKLGLKGEGHIVLNLTGSPSGPFSTLEQTFHLHGILSANWARGTASYRYLPLDGRPWQVVPHASVRQAPTETHQAQKDVSEHSRNRLQAAIDQLKSA
ncbi:MULTISPECIES: DUF1842 domain-containing protein [Pseudomonas]|uniref:DUF1842 domain-containing protein n=1 Tax=Pseudomonas donghuensis TaxID=1163398 RepID=A0AAP0SHH6_9PSED|nr:MULTISPECIES: DUF1842 domain-containing protein [Pseudomonas]MDF9894140.1 hypothetical protein [Pseudomonas vranovensis]KDN98557.1 DUF1842 domain-containing protein [Pseudomonas donghuensis]MBF4211056.1 DUF1842 domain-containing protein [Pseudomonas donghuensis]MCP6693633.1 DUF1842 domain-containing protein [Pseudomonas donghuensis]MCP6699524.1 DUF1842 domain-containing protein [Pseudomonas donghuensis]